MSCTRVKTKLHFQFTPKILKKCSEPAEQDLKRLWFRWYPCGMWREGKWSKWPATKMKRKRNGTKNGTKRSGQRGASFKGMTKSDDGKARTKEGGNEGAISHMGTNDISWNSLFFESSLAGSERVFKIWGVSLPWDLALTRAHILAMLDLPNFLSKGVAEPLKRGFAGTVGVVPPHHCRQVCASVHVNRSHSCY